MDILEEISRKYNEYSQLMQRKQVRKNWSVDGTISKVSDWWEIIRNGMKSTTIWNRLMKNKVLEDEQARKNAQWSTIYITD